ncbi:hypothetical protein H8356DRAFT_1417324 [Neocallimastix lanati (nom. inval.)]|nr:hypothetical protein H8356DRAFT_1417324 [Neocallimastix sp. JGI-2020a]
MDLLEKLYNKNSDVTTLNLTPNPTFTPFNKHSSIVLSAIDNEHELKKAPSIIYLQCNKPYDLEGIVSINPKDPKVNESPHLDEETNSSISHTHKTNKKSLKSKVSKSYSKYMYQDK